MRESTIQTSCTRIARRNKWFGFKWVSPGRRGVPDYIYLKGPPLRVIFVEYKKPDEEPKPIQRFVHRLLRRLGAQVEVISDTDHARRVFT